MDADSAPGAARSVIEPPDLAGYASHQGFQVCTSPRWTVVTLYELFSPGYRTDHGEANREWTRGSHKQKQQSILRTPEALPPSLTNLITPVPKVPNVFPHRHPSPPSSSLRDCRPLLFALPLTTQKTRSKLKKPIVFLWTANRHLIEVLRLNTPKLEILTLFLFVIS